MRIDGLSTASYPIKRKPRKAGARVAETVEDADGAFEVVAEVEREPVRPRSGGGGNITSLPARQQDMLFQRALSRSAAHAVASYMTTSGFVDWDTEVLGLDVHI